MTVTLVSSRLKLERALMHRKALERRIRTFARHPFWQRDVQHIISEVDSQTDEQVFKVRGNPRKVPSAIAPIVGDVIHNVRSALDHLAWSLVEVNGQTPGRHTQFPICETPDRFQGRGRGQIKGMSARAKELVKRTQPCYGGDARVRARLAWLEELSVMDKHRHLHLTVGALAGGFWNPATPIPKAQEIFVHQGPVEDGTILARFPKDDHKMQFRPAFDIAFDCAGPVAGESVGMTIRAIYHTVRRIVDYFDHEFFQ